MFIQIYTSLIPHNYNIEIYRFNDLKDLTKRYNLKKRVYVFNKVIKNNITKKRKRNIKKIWDFYNMESLMRKAESERKI